MALSPNLPRAHYALGRLLQREGKKEEAERELAIHHSLYEKGRQPCRRPTCATPRLALAWAELNQGRAAQALCRFTALPPSAESLRGRPWPSQRLGRHADAVRALERARAPWPRTTPASSCCW